jgi:hypothetical protein
MARGRAPAESPSWVRHPLKYVFFTKREAMITELKTYAKRKKRTLTTDELNSVWTRIEDALADYRGKSIDSPTPTLKARNVRVTRARSLASKLINELGFYEEQHVFGYINRRMMLVGGSAIELQNQLVILRDLLAAGDVVVSGPDGAHDKRRIVDAPRDDPYLADLILDLGRAWADLFNEPPGLTGVRNHVEPPASQRTGPFFRWVGAIFALSWIFPPSHRSVDRVVRSLKQNT